MDAKKEAGARPDPLIDEVRERRVKMFEAHGRDLDGVFEEIRLRQAKHTENLVDHRKRLPASPPTE